MSEMSPTHLRVSRRDVMRFAVVGGVVGTLAGCTSSPGPEPKPTSPGGPEDPDRDLRAEIGRDQAQLTALYAAADVPGSLAADVTDIGARHAAYGQAIDPRTPSSSATPSAPTGTSDGASSDTSASPNPTPTTPVVGVKGLRRAELASSSVLLNQAPRAVDPELARLIVLAAAGSAAAAEALRMAVS